MAEAAEGRQSSEPGQWTFWRKKDGSWHWRQTSVRGMSRVSRAGYRGLWDCMANAIYHGYLPPTAEAGHARAAA